MQPENPLGTLISEPRFSTPCERRFFPRDKGKTAFVEGFFLEKAFFPFSRGKNRISQGVENRGSLICVPLALRALAKEFWGWGWGSESDPHELRCEKIALCIAAFCVAALWCTKWYMPLWTRPFWATGCWRSPASLSSAQAASLCPKNLVRLFFESNLTRLKITSKIKKKKKPS